MSARHQDHRRSTRDLAGLRAAVQPVYRELESNPSTKAFIGEIVAMRQATGGTPDAASCSASQQARGVAVSATELQGTWQVTFNRSELKAAGAYPDEDLPGNYGHFTFTFDRGHFLQVGPRAGPGSGPASGTFVVNGDQITFHRSDHAYPGSDTEIWGPYRWSAYRDTLTFKKSGPGPMPTGLVVKAWRRSADSG